MSDALLAAAPAAAPATPAAAPVAAATPAPAAPAPAPTGEAPAAPAAPTPVGDPAPLDWAGRRTAYAGGDEKLEKRLARYSSEKDALDALIAAQNKITSGGLKAPLPKDATPEQLTEWRKDNGIPTTADDYKYVPPAGVNAAMVDVEAMKAFTQKAHEANMTEGQLKSTLDWYFTQQENELNTMRESDAATRKANEDLLRNEWGSEYRLNVNLINGMLENAPPGVKDLMWGARLGDGTELASNPDVLRWLATAARTINPVATVVPGGGSNAMQVIEGELASITKLMGDRKSEYWKGPTADKMQARYRELINVQSKLK